MRLNNIRSFIAKIKQTVEQTWQISVTTLKAQQASALYLLEQAL